MAKKEKKINDLPFKELNITTEGKIGLYDGPPEHKLEVITPKKIVKVRDLKEEFYHRYGKYPDKIELVFIVKEYRRNGFEIIKK